MSRAESLRRGLPVLLAVQERERERQAQERAAASRAADGASSRVDGVVAVPGGELEKKAAS